MDVEDTLSLIGKQEGAQGIEQLDVKRVSKRGKRTTGIRGIETPQTGQNLGDQQRIMTLHTDRAHRPRMGERHKPTHYVLDVNEFEGSIHRDAGLLAVHELVTERRDDRVVKRTTELPKDVGQDDRGEARPTAVGPCLQVLGIGTLGLSVGVVALDLDRGGEQDMRRAAGPDQGGNEAVRDGQVAVQDLIVRATVDTGEVNDRIGGDHEVVKRMVIGKGYLITGHSSILCRISMQQTPQMPPQEAVCPGDPDAHPSSPWQTTSLTRHSVPAAPRAVPPAWQ